MPKDSSPQKNRKKDRVKNTARLDGILARLSAVSEGYDIVTFLNTYQVDIVFEEDAAFEASSILSIEKIEDGAYVYSGAQIVLNTDLSDNNITQALVHEAQHIRHHLNGLGNPQHILSENEHQQFRGIQEADAQATAIDVTFKMKQAGDDGPYKRTGAIGYQDMCTAYERAYKDDPQSIHDGRAKRAAFEAWFGKPARVRHYDQDTKNVHEPFIQSLCQKYKQHGLKKGRLATNWINKIGGLSAPNYFMCSGFDAVLKTTAKTLKNTRDMPVYKKKPPAPPSPKTP